MHLLHSFIDMYVNVKNNDSLIGQPDPWVTCTSDLLNRELPHSPTIATIQNSNVLHACKPGLQARFLRLQTISETAVLCPFPSVRTLKSD